MRAALVRLTAPCYPARMRSGRGGEAQRRQTVSTAEQPRIGDRWSQSPDDPMTVIRLLDEHGHRGLQHLRLAADFSHLEREGIGERLKAGAALSLTANAHANMALVYLRKMLDDDGRAVGVSHLLRLMERSLPGLLSKMGERAPALRLTPQQLRRRIAADHRHLKDVRKQARPVLTVVNKMVVHLDCEHVRKPVARVPTALVERCFRDVQKIVNGWDQAWRCAHVLWDHPASRDDFSAIGAALRRQARQ